MANIDRPYGFTMAGIDTIGNTKIPSQEILDMLGILEGTHFEPGTLKLRKMRENIEALGHFSHVHIALVLYPDGKAYITVDVIEKAAERKLSLRPPPTGSMALPDKMLALYDEYMAQWDRSIRNRTLVALPDTETSHFGHRFSPDAHLRSLEEQFIDLAQQHQEILVDALEVDESPHKRRVAAAMLGWAPEPGPAVRALSAALSDCDAVVRNNAGLSLIYVSQISAHTDRVDVPLPPILEMLHLPFTTDRQKAALMLAELAKSKHPRPTILKEAGGQLMRMLELKQPSNRDAACEALRQLSGFDYGPEQQGEWRQWYQQATRGMATPLQQEPDREAEA